MITDNPIDTAVYQALQDGACVLTANNRLARRLQQAYARRCLEADCAVWQRPAIHTWDEWLQICQDALLDQSLDNSGGEAMPLLLNQRQCEAIWQQIIEQSPSGAQLLQTGATAQAAYEAWDRLCGWQVPSAALTQYDAIDVQAFAGWLEVYLQRSRREGWQDPPRLAEQVAAAVRDGKLALPSVIFLIGFDEPRPQQQMLMDMLAAQGCQLQTLPVADYPQARCEQRPCTDVCEEIHCAASWVRQQLERDPDLNIGVVVHNLAERRASIARVFDSVLCPAQHLPVAEDNRPDNVSPFNISIGRPLAETPLVRDALLALELAAGPVRWTTISALLRSPFFAGAEQESGNRARLDARLRRRGREQISLGDLHYHAGQAGCPALHRAVDQCRSLLEQIGGRYSAATQAGRIGDWLRALGWSHGRTLSSDEYQTASAWWDLLGEFAQLDAYAGKLTWQQALTQLQRLAGDKLFQPQSANAPVQILGLLEATGMQFDRLWIMGLHDGVWPASPRPHPLLPIPLQRQYDLPHATAERELDFARRTTQRLLRSAPVSVISWPQRQGDAELRISPLLADLPRVGDEGQSATPDLMHYLYATAPALEIYSDDPPPAWHSDETLRGGTAVLKNQAACPFRAFAEHRLHAKALDEPLPGLDAAGRGALVHEVMRAVWGELGDQAALLALDSNAQAQLAGRCVETALTEWETRHAGSLLARFREVESARLQALVNDWLQIDRQRAPFSVAVREHEQPIDIKGIHMRGRIDRLDRLADGRCLIIDYKTGKVDPKAWLDERPDDPQLPLYALAQQKQLSGLAFAQVRIGDLKYAGVADRDGVATGIETISNWKHSPSGCETLPDLLDYWHTQLGTLARSFIAGDSDVDPKQRQQTCRFCPQYTLCRIDELSLGHRDLEDDDD